MSDTLRTLDEVRELVIRELPRWLEAEPAFRQRLVKSLEKVSPVRKMSYEEFLEWADEDTLAEWVDGEVVIYSPASPRHQRISRFLLEVLGGYARAHDLGEVFPAPMQMKLERGREPDLLFVAREHLDRLEETHLDGPADVAVEIVSLESVGRDRGAKFTEYEAGHVPEYWLIDPQAEWAEFYRLEEGHYRLVLGGREGQYHALVLPGFWLRVEWLWQEPLPHPLRVLGEIGGVEPQVVDRFLQTLGEGSGRAVAG